jgi:carboxyl-terminal processing protease
MSKFSATLFDRSKSLSAALRSKGLLTLTVASLVVGLPAFVIKAKATLQSSPKAVLDEAWQVVNSDYVDPNFNHVDWKQVRQDLLTPAYTTPDQAYTALREALKKLNDPYTRFMDPKEYQAFNSETNGELVGVGMQLKQDKQTKALIVVKPIEGSPALAAGVQAGDRILQINGKSTTDMALDAAVNMIRGEAGSQVSLLLQHQNQSPMAVTLTRKRIELPTVRTALRIEGQQRVGYIRLEEFNGHAADQMKQAINSLKQQNVNAFVLDLRGNPGGRLDQVLTIAQMWLDNGPIVRTVDRDGTSEETKANHSALTNLPLAVLVDGGSASASEILTGALKDDHRAVIIGTQTFGKALVQESHPLADGSGINVTIAHYFTPSGVDINHLGITPDVVISLTQQKQQELASHPDTIGTDDDPQYQQALSALKRSS